MEELLADEVAFVPRERDQRDDLLGNTLLLFEGENNRLHARPEVRLRRLDARDRHAVVGIEEKLDDHHRVVSLLDRLPVEGRGELGERLTVVVDGDRDVLLGRSELVGDLLVQRIREPRHAPNLADRRGWSRP
jgi:hypothetical protein